MYAAECSQTSSTQITHAGAYSLMKLKEPLKYRSNTLLFSISKVNYVITVHWLLKFSYLEWIPEYSFNLQKFLIFSCFSFSLLFLNLELVTDYTYKGRNQLTDSEGFTPTPLKNLILHKSIISKIKKSDSCFNSTNYSLSNNNKLGVTA